MLAQRASGTSYDLTEKSPKKDKTRWSFGKLFRRKKKPECDSTSDEENNKKKKNNCNKPKRSVIGFDHVVIPSTSSRSTVYLNGYKTYNDSVLSEPSASNNFIPASSFTTKYVPLKDSQENLNHEGSSKSLESPSVNSLGRRKKEVIKARAEARRDHSKGGDSSEDDSQTSAFRSDESLAKYRDSSVSRRSRTARTQRYLKRRSRDEDFQEQVRFCKSDAEHVHPTNKGSTAKLNKSDFSGLSTIPPSHTRYKTINSTNGFMQKQYSDVRSKDSNCQRSSSCSSSMHNFTLENDKNPISGQLKPGKSNRNSNNTATKQPPVPPPRDPKRIYSTVNNGDDRPNSYSFENGYSRNGSDQSIAEPKHINFNSNHRSTSEDHISLAPNQRLSLVPRPSSAVPNENRSQKSSKSRQNIEEPLTNGYCYFADKNPRSRKPISIQPNESQKPFEFWKQKDEEVVRSSSKNSNHDSPLMFTAQTHVRTTTFLPNGVTLQTDSSAVDPSNNPSRVISPFRPITPIKSPSPTNTTLREEIVNNKPSNFEDALDELEAIYNSLHLGDEDLLERAEQRETAAAQKRRDMLLESFPYSASRGTLSDSSFTYDSNPTKKKLKWKKMDYDRKGDDMAVRKLNKERYNTISDPQSVTSRISYLLTSPLFNKPVGDNNLPKKTKKKTKEPDVMLDDVVYRNVKHNIDTLKINDPQLPFGIPLGLISPASNSDYLHATPENTYRSIFIPKKIPDVVKDDLAYRNLRKDPNKEPALPQINLSPEDYKNNYNSKSEITLRKKRPVRSLSANISNLLYLDETVNGDREDIDDIADALEVSRQILKKKEDRIKATNKAFMSDGDLKYKKFEDDFLQKQTKQKKKPLKSSRPNKEQQRAIEELLSSLAMETHKANEQITNELKIYDEEKKHKRALAESLASVKKNIEQSKVNKVEMMKELEKDEISKSLNLQLPKSDFTKSEHAKLCKKLLECVVESTELLATAKVEPGASEEVDTIRIEPLLSQTIANVVLTPDDVPLKTHTDPISAEIFSESDHDYVNIQCCEETTKRSSSTELDNEVQELLRVVNGNDEDIVGVSVEVSVSPMERHRAKLLAAFEELRMPEGVADTNEKDNISASRLETHEAELLAAFAEFKMPEEMSRSKNVQDTKKINEGGGEECGSVYYIALPVKEGCAFINEVNFNFDNANLKMKESIEDVDLSFRNWSGRNLDLKLESRELEDSNSEVLNDLKNEPVEVRLVINLEEVSKADFDENSSKFIHDASDLVRLDINSEELNNSSETLPNYSNCIEENSSNINVQKGTGLEIFSDHQSDSVEFKSNANLEELSKTGFVGILPNPSKIINNICDDEGLKLEVFSDFQCKSVDVEDTLDTNLEQVSKTDFDEILANSKINEETHSNIIAIEDTDLKDFSDYKNESLGELQSNTNLEQLSKTDFSKVLSNSSKNVEESHSRISISCDIDLEATIEESNVKIESNLDQNLNSDTIDNAKKLEQDSNSLENNSNEESKDRNDSSNNMSISTLDSRHTLKPSRLWYEDPAVVAFACSCGIACTTQLPNFDFIAVLGLLFAIILLLMALLARI